MSEVFLNGRVTLWAGNCLDALASFEEASFDSCATDPPYHLASIVKRFGAANCAPAKNNAAFVRASTGFMGQTWDGGDIAFDPATWAAVLRVLKPGAHLVAFGAPKNAHRLACAIEDAGFEIRDTIAWLFGSGFPKSHDVSKGIDRAAGEKGTFGEPKSAAHAGWIERGRMRGDDGHEGYQRPWMQDANAVDQNARQYIPATDAAAQWSGWGTALKPAYEPIILARKPLIGTVAENVLRYGTGAINIDGCRVEGGPSNGGAISGATAFGQGAGWNAHNNRTTEIDRSMAAGRWPANVAHDGSDEVVAAFPIADSARASGNPNNPKRGANHVATSYGQGDDTETHDYRDTGSAARFFYTAKADADDRLGSKHPTVKPLDLMQWLVRLVTPPGGVTLDLFAGTGTTGEAAWREGMRAVLIEREEKYLADIRRRMALVLAGPDERARESLKANGKAEGHHDLPLFDLDRQT